VAGGHPQTPARGISLWTPFTTVMGEDLDLLGDEEISGIKWRDGGLDCFTFGLQQEWGLLYRHNRLFTVGNWELI